MASEELRIIINSTANVEGIERTGNSLMDLYARYQMIQQAVSLVSEAVQQAWQFISESAREAGVRESFRELAASAGMSAGEILRAMQEAADGTVRTQSLIQSANRLLVANFEFTADDLGTLLAIARERAQSMGLSVEEAFNRLILGLTRGSVEMLDELGIIARLGEATQEYADTLGISVDQLTAAQRGQALFRQVIEDNRESVAGLTERLNNQQTAIARIETTWTNLTDAVGAFFANASGGASILEFLSDRLDTLAQAVNLTLSSLSAGGAFLQAMRQTGGNIEIAMNAAILARDRALVPLLEIMGQVETGALDLNLRFRQLAADLSLGTLNAEEFTEQWRAAVAQVGDPTMATALRNVATLFEMGHIPAQTMLNVVNALVDELGIIPQAVQEASAALEEMSTKLAGAGSKAGQIVDPFTAAFGEIDANLVRAGETAKDDADAAYEDLLNAGEKFADDLVAIAQRREDRLLDIARQGSEKRADATLAAQRKEEDISLDTGDKLVDLLLRLGNNRIDIEKDYWRAVRDLREQGSADEQEAIRRRDARSLAQQRQKREADLRDAAQKRDDNLDDLSETERRQRQLLNLAAERARRDNQTNLRRQLEDTQTWQQRAEALARDQAAQDLARRRAEYAQEEATLEAHWRNMVLIVENYAKRMSQVASGAGKGVLGTGGGVMQTGLGSTVKSSGGTPLNRTVQNGRSRVLTYGAGK